MAGSPAEENRYLDKYRSNPLCNIIEQEHFRVPPRTNCNLNWFRAIFYHTNENPLLVIEDDIVFTSSWRDKLDKVIEEIPSKSYMLSLYKGSHLKRNGTEPFVEIPHREFFSSLGLLWVNVPLQDLALYLWKHGVDTYEKPVDLLITDWLEYKGIPIYTTYPSLVQHTGRISTIGSKWTEWCQSESFVP